MATQRRERIRIACVPTLASTRLGNILTNFKRRYPRSVVELKETSTTAAAALLQNQEIELFIGPEIPRLADFHFEPVLEDRLVACVPPEFDGGMSRMTMKEIADFPLIVLDHQTAIRSIIDRISDENTISLNIEYEVQHAYTAMALASAGVGVAVVPLIAVPMLSGAAFRVVPISDAKAERAVGILTARGHVLHGYTLQLMDLIRKELRR